MNPTLCAIGIVLLVAVAGCGSEQREGATLEPDRGASTTISSSADPATASPAPPDVTASSAAASAPECKDLKEADPAACQPAATGDPNTKQAPAAAK